MDNGDHLLNAALLSVGLAVVLSPPEAIPILVTTVAVAPPIVLGTLLPDVDATLGSHRKTLHNLPLLVLFYVYPLFFGNLDYVWIGIGTHYVLDLFGTERGLALLYPLGREFSFPVGVPPSSIYATFLTLVVTALELAVVGTVLSLDLPVVNLGTP